MKMQSSLVYILPIYTKDTHTHHRHLYQMIEQIAKQMQVFVIVEKGESVDIPCIVGSKILPRFRALRFFSLIFTLLKLRTQGYHKIYVHYSYLGVIAAKFTGFKIWYWNCGQMWLFGGVKNTLLLRAILHMVHRLVTGTKFMARGYSGHYKISLDRIAVVPNWIRISEWGNPDIQKIAGLRNQLSIPKESFVILFVHRLAARKGSRYLPEIWTEVLKRPDVHMIVAGDGPDRAWLEDQALQDSSFSSRVHILGAVPNHEIKEYMHMADVFIMPSQEEGFPRVSIEAMAAGTPVVAFDTGGLNEIVPVELSPYIYKIGGVEKFSQGILSLLGKKIELQEVLKKNVERFDIEVVAHRFIDLLSQK